MSPRLSAFGSLRRGAASLRANGGLVGLNWLGVLLLSLLFSLGALLPMLAVGFDLPVAYDVLVEGDLEPLVRGLPGKLAGLTPAFAGAALGALALWTLAFLVYCWLQAGTYGVLIAADRQAPAGPPRGQLAFRTFRTFSGRDFAGWAGRYLWRYFWLLNVLLLLATPLLVALLGWLALTAFGAERWGPPAALGIGCGGALPVGFLFALFALWNLVAMADAAREGSGVWAAVRHGLRVLGRRPGACFLLASLFVLLVALEMGAVLLPATFAIQTLTAARTGARAAALFSLNAVQALANAVLSVLFAAAFVALAQSELRAEPAALPRSAAA
ncbi:MAG TPA: hypothetical protein VF121_12700 [Thermoanaerobaculia bacterium]|nr:hypothetical protein [Thermoanaerobaculia bacterium]